MTLRARVLPAALLGAGLLAVVLAIVAGIFGMHVMTAHHSPHAGHAGTVNAGMAHPAAGHTAGHTAVVHPHADQVPGSAAGYPAAGATFSADESCGSGCPCAQEAGEPCVPLAKAASLALVPPQTGPAGPGHAANDCTAVGSSHIPPSPTPCDLSISRT